MFKTYSVYTFRHTHFHLITTGRSISEFVDLEASCGWVQSLPWSSYSAGRWVFEGSFAGGRDPSNRQVYLHGRSLPVYCTFFLSSPAPSDHFPTPPSRNQNARYANVGLQ